VVQKLGLVIRSTESSGVESSSRSRRPELAYLKAVNAIAPQQDPQLLFLLMAEYSNANLQGDGAESVSRGSLPKSALRDFYSRDFIPSVPQTQNLRPFHAP
jgi:hypothetical protein